MEVLPSLTTVKEIADCGRYDILPVSCEMLSDVCTPIEALRILKNVSHHCYILESVAGNEKWGRYTFLGFDPKMEITCRDGKMKIGELSVETDNPTKQLREIMSKYKSPKFDYLPSFTGGLVGYFSYDYLGYSEPAVRTNVEDKENFKDVDLMLFDKVIAFDNFRQKIILIVNMSLEDYKSGYNKAVFELNNLKNLLLHGERKKEESGKLTGEVSALFSKKEFCGMVGRAKHYIKEGDIFQIVLSNRLSAPFEGSLLDTYRVLRTINPSPYMFYFSGTGGDGAHSFNISTTSALVVASSGMKVAKHGNRAASSKCGTADCLEALGVNIEQDPEKCVELLDKVGMCFFFAQKYHTSMKYVGAIRKEFGFRTVFNILGPLTNPGSPKFQLLGVYDEYLAEPLAQVLINLGVKRGMVVYGQDKLDEISMSAPTTICEFKDGWYKKYVICPEDFGFTRCTKKDLEGGTPEENAKITRDILSGQQGHKRNAILMNAGASLYIGGKAESMEIGIELAAELIDSGKALETLEKLIVLSNK